MLELLDEMRKILLKLSFLQQCVDVISESSEDIRHGYFLIFDEVINEMIEIIEKIQKSPA